MPWQIGAFTFPDGENPTLPTKLGFDGGEQIWSEFEPVGSNKTILTFLGQSSQRHELYAIVSEASKNSLKAIYDARAEVTFISPRTPGGVTVMMTKLIAQGYPGMASLFQCWITLVER